MLKTFTHILSQDKHLDRLFLYTLFVFIDVFFIFVLHTVLLNRIEIQNFDIPFVDFYDSK